MKKAITPDPNPTIVKLDEWTAPSGQTLTPGTEITVRGMGRVIFHSHSTNTRSGAEWLDVFQPQRGQQAGKWRAAQVDAVTQVHRLRKVRT